MRHITLLASLCICCSAASICAAQHDDRATMQQVVGCWKLESGRFSVSGRGGVDPGQTTLPRFIQLDTVAGKSWRGEPMGRLVRALPDSSGTRYRNGFYVPGGEDSLRIEWTNGFVGMTLVLRVDSAAMRGRASAWTDYMGGEEASIVLRRTACPVTG